MAKDYAKRQAPRPKKSSDKRPILRVVMAVVVLLLLSGGGLWFWSQHYVRSGLPPVVEAKPLKVKSIKKTSTLSEKKPLPPVEFEFYSMLPKVQVTADTSANSTTATNAASQEDAYWLQVGAFFTQKGADDLQGRLQLLGVDATIDTIVSKSTQRTIYRVQVGPFDSYQLAKQKQEDLEKMHMDSLLHRIG